MNKRTILILTAVLVVIAAVAASRFASSVQGRDLPRSPVTSAADG